MKRSLVVSEEGSQLGLKNERFEIRVAGHGVRNVRVGDLEEIVLMGDVDISTRAVAAALRAGIEILYLTPRGSFRGRASSGRGYRAELVVAQSRAVSDDQRRLRIAASIVFGKIVNQRRILQRAQRRLRDETIAASAVSMRHLLPRCAQVSTLDQLRGLEGQAAALYWKGFSKALRNDDFSFRHRRYRPPTDPVNACLSFGYALLSRTCESIAYIVGMLPELGFLHDPLGRRPSLALDLMEEFRPVVVDRLVLRLINRRQLVAADFEHPSVEQCLAEEVEQEYAGVSTTVDSIDGPTTTVAEAASEVLQPVYLAANGRRIVLSALYKHLREPTVYRPLGTRRRLREVIDLQARHLARVMLGEDDEYKAFEVD